MSFFRRLFGGLSEADERVQADALFDAGNAFEARIAYERLRDRRDASADTRAHADERIARCLDQLAESRIAEATRLLARGELDLARTELTTACELARTESIRKRAARMLDTAERNDARVHAVEAEPDDDERWAMLASTWSDAQLDEYDRYGEDIRTAVLALDAGSPETARPLLEALGQMHEASGVFLFAELGRARARLDDDDGAAKAVRLFLKRVPDEDRSETRVQCYSFLAALEDRRGNDEKAVQHLERAIDVMPDDPRPLLNMGEYLRVKGEAEQGITFIEAALQLLDEDQPNWPTHLQLALAKRDAGRTSEAIETLERIVRYFVGRSQLDLPAIVAVPLAQLHEREGNPARAADLYATLARGSDRANHLTYHREAGRLLREIGQRQEARRMLTRASALADKSSEISADIEAILAELEKDELS